VKPAEMKEVTFEVNREDSRHLKSIDYRIQQKEEEEEKGEVQFESD